MTSEIEMDSSQTDKRTVTLFWEIAVLPIVGGRIERGREIGESRFFGPNLAEDSLVQRDWGASAVTEHANAPSSAPIPRQRLEPGFNFVDGSKELVHRDLSGNSCSLGPRSTGSRGRCAAALARTALPLCLLSLAGVFGSNQVFAAESGTAAPNVFAAALGTVCTTGWASVNPRRSTAHVA